MLRKLSIRDCSVDVIFQYNSPVVRFMVISLTAAIYTGVVTFS